MNYARYLKLEPETYTVERDQLFQIEQCQFCGEDHFEFRKYLPSRSSSSAYNEGLSWKATCMGCKKTVLVAKKHDKTK